MTLTGNVSDEAAAGRNMPVSSLLPLPSELPPVTDLSVLLLLPARLSAEALEFFLLCQTSAI